MALQRRQVSRQEEFAKKVDKQIADFDLKMDMQAHAIRYYNMWNEPNTE